MASAYRWVVMDNGRSVFCKPGQAGRQRSSLPCPTIKKDTIDPVQSMADGKVYDTLSGLRHSYRADGNPAGIDYQEIGDDTSRTGPVTPKVTKQECTDLLDQYEAAANRGETFETLSVQDA